MMRVMLVYVTQLSHVDRTNPPTDRSNEASNSRTTERSGSISKKSTSVSFYPTSDAPVWLSSYTRHGLRTVQGSAPTGERRVRGL